MEIYEIALMAMGGLTGAILLWQSTSKVFIDMCCAFYDQMVGQFAIRGKK